MNLKEKQEIAAIARRLVTLLQECDDEGFVDDVIGCIQDGDKTIIEPQRLR